MGRDTIPISAQTALRDDTSGGVCQHPPFVTPATAVWVKIPVSICLAQAIPYGRQRHPYGGGEAVLDDRVACKTAPKAPFFMVAHVDHRWPTPECGERASKEPLILPAKAQIRREMPENGPSITNRIRGDCTPATRAWSAQPTSLAAGAATPPFGQGPYCGLWGLTQLPLVVPPLPLPSLRSGPTLQPHVRHKQAEGAARLSPAVSLRPPHGNRAV